MSAPSELLELDKLLLETETEDDLLLEGDLGHGLGLKPGGIPNFCNCSMELSSKSNLELPHFAYLCQCKDGKKAGFRSYSSSERVRGLSGCSSSRYSTEADEISELIQQQRNMFSVELKKIFHPKQTKKTRCLDPSGDCSDTTPCITAIELQRKLRNAQEVIEQLHSELEIHKRLLYGKYKASEVLVKQLNKVKEDRKSIEKTIKDECVELQKEVNALQFALECTEYQLTNSQQNWLDRYNGVSDENSELSKTVKEQANMIKTLLATRLALNHERDELLVLLDAKERLAFRRSTSLSSEDSCSEVTSFELSTLGACMCRGTQQEPCRCAQAACSKQRHIVSLNKQIQKLEKKIYDTHCIAQTFQTAFEEQLKKNRSNLRLLYAKKLKSDERSKFASLMKKSRNEKYEMIIDNLVNLVCDKNEALLHQRLVTKLLGKKLQDIEQGYES